MRALLGRAALSMVVAALLVEVTVRVVVSVPAVQDRLFGGGAPPELQMTRTPLGAACAGGMTSTVQHDPDVGWVAAEGLHVFDAFRQEVVPPGVRSTGVQAAEGARRVALVGDSFTFGHDVDDDATWAAGLARRRPDLEILDFGVDGYGHDQVLLRVRRDVLPLRPDLVVLGFVHVDVLRNGIPRFRRLRPRVSLQAGELVVAGVPVPTPEEDCRALLWSPWTVQVVRMLGQKPMTARLPEALELTEAILDALAVEVRAAGAELVVVELPEAAATMADPRDRQGLGPPYLGFPEDHPGFPLADWCARRGVTCLDGREAFAGVEDLRALFVSGFHHGPEGHDRIAAWLAPRLVPLPP